MDSWTWGSLARKLGIASLVGLVAFLIASFCLAQEVPRDVAQPDVPGISLRATPPDFQHLDRGWLKVEFPASVRERVEAAIGDTDTFRSRLSADLGQTVLEHAVVRVARGPEQMAELAPVGSPPPSYASGVAYPVAHLILLSLKAPGSWEATDLEEVLRHELTHLALADALASHPVPLWFNEGFAIRESGELRWQRTRTLWSAQLANRLLTLDEIERAFPLDPSGVSLAYAESADVVRFLMRDADRARFGSLVQRVRAGAAFETALRDAYGIDTRKLEYEWREGLKRQFPPLTMFADGWVLWPAAALLMGIAWFVRRRRAATKLAEWAREEARADAASSAHRPAPAPPPPVAGLDEVPTAVPAIPVVEHEGRWHTLH
jgi:hypothetical protein